MAAALLAQALLALAPPRATPSARAPPPLAALERGTARAEHVDVLIAGGGPAGLAAALSLASCGRAVTLVERREHAAAFEAQRAYLYLLDRRGQRFTDAYGLTEQIRARGVPNDEYSITRAWPDARGVVTSRPLLAQESTSSAIWIPRAVLLELLAQAAAAAGATLLYQCSIEKLTQGSGGERVRVAVSSGERRTTFAPRLLLGCDGANSLVRSSLAAWGEPSSRAFTPVRLPSPSSELQYKMLLVPPSFALKNLSAPAASDVWTESRAAYTIPSRPASSTKRLRLGLLPCRDQSLPRTANIIKPASHDIWKCSSGEELLSYLNHSFPQIADISSFVTPDEADAFVAGAPGRFPRPQFVPQLSAQSGGTAVALLGDAAHAFPPDMGQGVNSALEDVHALVRALGSNGALQEAPAAAWADALERYNEQRAPAAEAIARIMQVGFPYQYDQSFWRAKLFLLGFGARLLLSKAAKPIPLVRHLFAQPVAFSVLEGREYAVVWHEAQRTTRILQCIGLTLVAAVLRLLRATF